MQMFTDGVKGFLVKEKKAGTMTKTRVGKKKRAPPRESQGRGGKRKRAKLVGKKKVQLGGGEKVKRKVNGKKCPCSGEQTVPRKQKVLTREGKYWNLKRRSEHTRRMHLGCGLGG